MNTGEFTTIAFIIIAIVTMFGLFFPFGGKKK